jgi:hypothetical protein
MAAFTELLAKHVGAAYARQLAFLDLIGDRHWSLKTSEGVVRFGNDLAFPIQLLGTESSGDNSWLWAWANEQSRLPPQLLVACNQLRDIGAREGTTEFCERSFSLDKANGHSLASVASGIVGDCCYFRGPYDGGALYFLVQEIDGSVLAPVASERAVTVLSEVISQFDVDHRVMSEAFLRSQGFSLESTPDGLQAVRRGDAIQLSLDAQGRITNIGATIQPQPPAAKQKRWWEFWK